MQLIRAYDAATAEERQQYVEGAKALRLMVTYAFKFDWGKVWLLM